MTSRNCELSPNRYDLGEMARKAVVNLKELCIMTLGATRYMRGRGSVGRGSGAARRGRSHAAPDECGARN